MKRWRTKAGVSREELGAASNYAPDTIKAMEQGVRMPTPKLLDAADELLRAEGLLSAAKPYLRRHRFPARALNFMVQEREAINLWSYEVALVQGLLQTETYARDLIGNFSPSVDAETVEERVLARLERQKILSSRPPVAFTFVLYEAALRGRLVDKEQLLHLLEVGARRNISLQVLPYERGIPAALSGSMVLLETRNHERFAFAEGPFASELTSEPEAVSAATERLSMIRMEALGAEDSARFLERMVDEL
ncbi:helix-turn-helix transcriptional regulator [Streptomyces sp. NPDC051569]|uniref:helix-turn-helix transcriptional regulator n=1 Tax=Streptomyces sp. NPDC051569 TaxID=3365661 RepID=UPI0037992E49